MSASDRQAAEADRAWPPAAPLRTVYLEPTARCNLACAHCYVDRSRAREERELAPDELLALVPQLAGLGVRQVVVTGGEALLRPDLLELAAALAGRGIKVVVATNGLLLTRDLAQALAAAAPGAELFVSLDGLTPESHGALRRAPGREPGLLFARALDAIRIGLDAGLATSVSTMIHRGNLQELPGIDRLLGDLGVGFWWLALPKPLGRFAAGAVRLAVDGRDLPAALQRLVDEHLRRRAAGQSRPRLEVEGLGRPGEPPAVGAPAGEAVCSRCSAHGCAIRPNGDVARCVYLGGLAVGNVRRRSLASLWHSVAMRELVEHPVARVSACAGCPDLAFCGAGCRANARAAGGTFFDGADPSRCGLARFAHHQLPALLARHGAAALSA